MRFIARSLLLGNVLFAKTALCSSHVAKSPSSLAGNGIVQKYIVEISEGSSIELTKGIIRSNNVVVQDKFDCPAIFTGAVIEASVDNIDSIRKLPGVVSVWPVRTISTPSSPLPGKIVSQKQPKSQSVHRWTGVDRLHAAGIKGRGTKIAVVDTGIDYTHEALGGCFGRGCKIAGGYDLVGPTWNLRSERTHPKKQDNDPMDFKGHGTHVAGIIAGHNDWFLGVAPEAELLAYKVFSDEPGQSDTTEDVLIQAFCDAYLDGADVITASVNRPEGFVDNSWALVASRIVHKGVFVSIAAGNEGEQGPFFSGVGSNGLNVVSVAAINTTGDPQMDGNSSISRPTAAYFSSWGPTNELLLKPDIGAPGCDILSTYLNQEFKTDSGSSMAAPYVAGIAALYISKNGGRELHGSNFAVDLANRIVASGRNVAWSTGEIKLNESAPPYQVGSGLVDAHKVVSYTTELSLASFSLLDTELFKPIWDVNITNNSNKTIRYSFEYESLPGVEIYDGVSDIKRLSKLQPLRISPLVTLPPNASLTSGQTKSFRFKFTLPEGVNDNMLPLYSGKIHIKGSNGERLCMPYGGAAYDTEKAFDTMFDGEPMIDGWHDGATWSFDPGRTPADFANLACRLSYPCVHLRWDIFERDWTELEWNYPLEIGKDRYIGSATSVRNSDKYLRFDASVIDIDDTISFPLMRVPRGYQRFWWFGKLANGTHIAPGNYSMRIAALRPYGDPTISDHWDIMDMDRQSVQILPRNGTTPANIGFLVARK